MPLIASLNEAIKSYRLKLTNLRAKDYVDMATTKLAKLYVGLCVACSLTK